MSAIGAGCGEDADGSGGAGDAGTPARPPDVSGVVRLDDGTFEAPYLAEPSDSYFEGMYLLRGDPPVFDRDGEPLAASDLADGDPVDVWVADVCAESFPVQCEVLALRLGDASEPPGGEVAADDRLIDALGGAGVDVGSLPPPVAELDDRRFCGAEEQEQPGEGDMSPAARCFLDHHLAQMDATYVRTSPTIEGDPITTVLVTGGGGSVASFVDSTRDSFGSGAWARYDSARVAVSVSSGVRNIEPVDPVDVELDAELPAEVDEEPPDWFTERPELPWCGMDVRIEDLVLDARECFRDAASRGEPAEYAFGRTDDEGRVRVQWLRVLDTGGIEVIERTLPAGPSDDPSEAQWRRLRCSGIGFTDEPGTPRHLLPLVEEATCTEQ